MSSASVPDFIDPQGTLVNEMTSPPNDTQFTYVLQDLQRHMAQHNTLMQQLLAHQTASAREQTSILREISARQAEQDSSTRPIPQVPLRNASAWNPLLKSTHARIAPTLARWRGGLDTMLIFIGLFSAVVTAFLVESLADLQVDEPARTNELLLNLTNLLVTIHTGGNITFGDVAPPEFAPDDDSLRVNVLWSLSLISSLSLAALAVVGRAFLSKLTRPSGDSVSRLTDIHQRWPRARTLLGRCLEYLPLALVVPVFLFILGFLDRLTSLSLHQQSIMQPIFATAIVGCIIVGISGCIVASTLIHGAFHPYTSPFRFRGGRSLDVHSDTFVSASITAYHHAIQTTYDDNLLDDAAAALKAVMQHSNPFIDSPSDDERSLKPISSLELDTLLHLLSPESSTRGNLTVAHLLLHCSPIYLEKSIPWTQKAQLLSALLKIVKHHHLQRNDTDYILKSPFLSAMACIIQSQWKLLTMKLNLIDFSVNSAIISGPRSILVLLTAHFISQATHDPEIQQVYRDCTVFAHGIVQSIVHTSAGRIHEIADGARYTLSLMRPYTTTETTVSLALTNALGDKEVSEEHDTQTFILLLFLLHASADEVTDFNRLCNHIISWLILSPGNWLLSKSIFLASGSLISPLSMANPLISHRLLKVITRLCHHDYPEGVAVANQFIHNILSSEMQSFISLSTGNASPLPMIFCELGIQFLDCIASSHPPDQPSPLRKFSSTVDLLHSWFLNETMLLGNPASQSITNNAIYLVMKLSACLSLPEQLYLMNTFITALWKEAIWTTIPTSLNLLDVYLHAIMELEECNIRDSGNQKLLGQCIKVLLGLEEWTRSLPKSSHWQAHIAAHDIQSQIICCLRRLEVLCGKDQLVKDV